MSGLIGTLQAFVQSNGLTAFIETFILIFFAGAAVSAMLSSLMQPPAAGVPGNRVQRFTSANNFTQASTIVAGLVLTAATGVLGKPANIRIAAVQTNTAASSGAGQQLTPAAVSAAQTLKDPQRDAFKTICAWLYVVLGVGCFLVWVMPTPANHDLVRNIGLTTLGFATSIISNLQLPSAG